MYQIFKKSEAVANRCNAMETETILKNEASPKSLMSRGNFLVCATIFFVFWGFTNKAVGQSYNATGAVAYSEQWINEINDNGTARKSGSVNNGLQNQPNYHNKDYIYYGTKNRTGIQYGNDCANFVSQCLKRGGGLNFTGYSMNSEGHIINCVPLHQYLRGAFSNANYETRTVNSSGPVGGVPDWLKPGDIVIWWNNGVGTSKTTGSNHAAIVATNDKLLNAHTSNRWQRPTSWFGNGSGWRNVSFYQIPANVTTIGSSARPLINITIQNTIFQDNDRLIRSGNSGNEQVKITVNNVNEIDINNIKLIFLGIAGQPEYSDSDTPAYWNGNKLKTMTRTGNNNYNYEAGSGNRLWWYPQTPEAWNGKWVKFVVVNTRGYNNDETNPDFWDNRWIASEPRYVRVVPSNTVVNDLRPIITSANNQTFSNIYDVKEIAFGNDINLLINGRGYVGDDSWNAWDNSVDVFYAILSGNPQYSSWDEPVYNNHKYGAWHDESIRNRFSFTPETASDWEGRYIKMIAWNTQYQIWGEPRYVRITPTLATLTVSQGTLSPSFNPNTTSYTVNVANSITSITLSATANSSATTISGTGNKTNLQIGNNTYTITVTGTNGANKIYTVTVNRAASTTPGCTNAPDGLYPSATFTPSCTGSNETITSSAWAGEYSVVSVTNGTSYTFSSSNSSDYLTIANSTGTTVLAYGTTPVTWTATSSNPTIRFYTHTNSSCGTSSTSRSRIVKCGTSGTCKTPPYYDVDLGTPSTQGTHLFGQSVPSNGCIIYRMYVSSGRKYFAWPQGTFNAETSLYNSSGTLIPPVVTGIDKSMEWVSAYTGYAYVRIKESNNNSGSFTFLYGEIPIPGNDQCSNAIALTCGVAPTPPGTLTGATPTTSISYSMDSNKNDVFYSFTAANAGNYTITLNDFSGDKDLFLHSNCSSTSALSSARTSNPTERITYTCTAGTTYLIRVTDYDNTGGTFNIKVDCPITYTVAYNGNGNTGGSTSSSSHTYDAAKNLTCNGFTRTYTVTYNYNGNGQSNSSAIATYPFDGWATSSSGAKIYNDCQSVSNLTATNGATVTLYAKWNNGSVTLPTPTRTGYQFAGWYTASSGGTYTGGGGASYTPTAAITLYAQWTNNPVINTSSNPFAGGSTSGGGNYNPSASCTVCATANTGYTFTNWIENSSVVSTNTCYTFTVTGNRNLVANFTANTYTIIYDCNGGTGGSTTSSTHTYDVAKPLTNNGCTKTGYTFAGWATSASGSVVHPNQQLVTNLTSTNGATITLYAKWTANTYTVVYNGNGNTGGSTAQSSHTYDVARNLTSNGFTRVYTVTYNYNGNGQSNSSATATYPFAGWATSSSGAAVYSNSQSVSNLTATNDSTVTLYAKWYNGSVALPAPTRTGYTFTGWFTTSSGGTKIGNGGETYTPTAHITLYAQWTITSSTLCTNPPNYDIDLGIPPIQGVHRDGECVTSNGCIVYRMYVTSGRKYFAWPQGTFNAEISLYNSSGTLISPVVTGIDKSMEWVSTYTGYAYVRIREINNNNGCFAFLHYGESATNSIDNIVANQLSIYPNPAKHEIFIESELPITKVEVSSLTGNLLILENNFNEKISVSALPRGVYLLKIYTDKEVAVSKIVKE